MPKGCNCASATCSCQIAGGGNVSIDGVGSESNPYTINVDPTQTDFINSSTVTWSPVTGQGTEASPFLVTASAAGGIPVGGNTGQHLAKKSNTNFDMEWVASGAALTTFSASAICTVALTVTATDSDVVGMSVTVAVGSTSDVFVVTTDFDVSVTAVVTGTFIGRLAITGVSNTNFPQAIWNIQAGAIGNRNIATQTHRITGLAAGTYTFKGTASSSVTGFRVNTTHSTITVHQVGAGVGVAPYNATELAAGVNLDTITTPGLYTQSQTAEASGGTNYPAPVAGLLEVFGNFNNPGGVMVWQRFSTYNHGSYPNFIYIRTAYNGAWNAWTKIAGDTGWIDGGTGTSIITANATNITLTGSQVRVVDQQVFIYLSGTLKVAITPPASSDIGNTTFGTLAAAYTPSAISPPQALSTANLGRMVACTLAGNTGNVTLVAMGGSSAAAIGDAISLSGSYLLN